MHGTPTNHKLEKQQSKNAKRYRFHVCILFVYNTESPRSAALLTSLSADGLEAAGNPELGSASPSGANQVSVKLTKHDWMT